MTKNEKQCTFGECENCIYAKGLCRAHYQRARKTGGDPTPYRDRDRACTVDGCDRPDNGGRGMCKKHYAITYYYERVGKRPVDPNHPSYKSQTNSYDTLHGRVRAARGRAGEYDCVDCGLTATDWSLKHDAAGKRYLTGGRYDGTAVSDDIYDYEPRCADCHKEYDARTANRTFPAGGRYSRWAV